MSFAPKTDNTRSRVTDPSIPVKKRKLLFAPTLVEDFEIDSEPIIDPECSAATTNDAESSLPNRPTYADVVKGGGIFVPEVHLLPGVHGSIPQLQSPGRSKPSTGRSPHRATSPDTPTPTHPRT